MADLTIQQVRTKYPQYKDMTDQQLANALHQKYYADMPIQTFYQKIGLKQPEGSPVKGAIEGAMNVSGQAVTTPISGAAGAAGALEAGGQNLLNAIGVPVPHVNVGDRAQNWMQQTQAALNKPFLTIGTPEAQQGLKTRAANQAVQQATQTAIGAIPRALQNAYLYTHQFTPLAMSGKETMEQQAKREAVALPELSAIGQLLPVVGMPRFAPKEMPKAPVETPFKTARNLGYKVAPSDAVYKGGNAPIASRIEGTVGTPKLNVEASVKNQPVTNDIAAKDIGVPKGLPLTSDAIDAAAAPHYKVYNEMKGLGQIPIDNTFKQNVEAIGNESQDAFPMDANPAISKLKQAYLEPDSFGSKGAVLKIRQLRKDGNLNIASRDPEKMALGYAQRDIATQIEDQVDRYASSRPEGFDRPDLVNKFRKARQAIAKIETVRDSIRPGTTDVSASLLARKLNKGAPLSGGLRNIAETYNNFPSAMRDAGPLRNKGPVNKLEGLIGGAGAVAAAMTHNPKYLYDAGAYFLAPPLTRSYLLSEPFQNSMLPKPPINPLLQQVRPKILPASFLINQGNKQ